jgi:hypothetical protein
LQDSSVYSGNINSVFTENVMIGQSIIANSLMSETFFGEVSIGDSSIIGDSIINHASSVSNSLITNSWTNTWKLFVGIDPSGNEIYEYVMSDDTLPIDSSSWTVYLNNSEIWDSSINNASINDCSIFRCYLKDVSLNNCTIYNTELNPDFYQSILDNNRIIMIDPSIQYEVIWDEDSSLFYTKSIKRLDVGMNGCSTSEVMSAGDYLDWVTTNDYWNKFGDIYIWTSAPDGCSDCRNLIDGFYVYNPHSFTCKIEYMLFI